MNWTSVKIYASIALGFVVAPCLPVAATAAQTAAPLSLQLPGRAVLVGAPALSAAPELGLVQAALGVTLQNTGSRSFAVTPSDFELSAQADMFGARGWDAGSAPVVIGPHSSRVFHLTFRLPSAALAQATLFYHPADGVSGVIPLNGSPSFAGPKSASSARSTTSSNPTINTYYVSQGVGDPWGTAIDSAGNVWFAEPGCDFSPTCPASTPPGQIGELTASTHNVVFYTLPNIPGNQPIFLAFDGSGKLWFTTPNNSEIGEFNPSTGKFVGQWPVTSGSGPWDLTFYGGQLWYTEHLVSAIGDFNPSTHTYQDFQTPSADSNPYGIAKNGAQGLIWFTENNGNVDQVGVLNTSNDAISEYPIVLPLNGTPHLISIGGNGHPWWSEGWSDTIATLNPADATPGQCGTTSGTCNGIHRFTVPPSTTCSTSAHTSGIAVESSANLVWLDNSLTAQVGYFNLVGWHFTMYTLSNCGAHPHDGLRLDTADNVWFDEEFGSAIGELIP